jgi:hypothetical protein
MKNKLITLQVSPENSASKLPNTIRLSINKTGDMLNYKQGAIPFLYTQYPKSDGNLQEDFSDIFNLIVTNKDVLSKTYILENFWVYNIGDYGSQALSAGFDDFLPICFDNSGFKIPLTKIATIKNYTSKEVYILISKSNFNSQQITIIIEPRRINSFEKEITITRQNSNQNFILNLKNAEISELSEIDFFINGKKINNSEIFFSISNVSDFTKIAGSEFVSKQENYFSGTGIKNFHDVTITLSDNFRNINTITAKSRKNYPSYIYNRLAQIQLVNLPERTDYVDVYKQVSDYTMKKLIPGVEFYISENKLFINQNTNNDFYEVIINQRGVRFLSIPFTGYTSFNLQQAMYYNNISNWNIDDVNSSILLFGNGLFIKKGYTADHSYTYNSSIIYEYVITDITLKSISINQSYTNYNLLGSVNLFNNFNEYQIQTDPMFNTYGEIKTIDNSLQEVFLYNKDAGFKVESLEPFYNVNNGKITIQGFSDPFPALLTTQDTGIIDNYTDFQENFGSGKTKIATLLHSSTPVQSIETNILQLKKNYLAIANNSAITYTAYTTQITSGEFLFAIFNGVTGTTFNIIYRNSSTNAIIKKEYNCKINLNNGGKYISIPFFFNTFSGTGITNVTIQLEYISGSLLSYYLFR